MVIKKKQNTLWILLKAMSKNKIAVILFSLLRMTSVLVFILILPMVLNKIVGDVSPKNALGAVLSITSTYVLRAVINFLSDLLKAKIVPSLESEIKKTFFRYTQDTTEEYDSGKIADLVDKSTSSLIKMHNVLFQNIIPSFFLVVIVMIIFARKNIRLFICTFLWIFFHTIISILIYKITRPLYVKSMEIHNTIQGFIVDNFSNKKIELFFNSSAENMKNFSLLQEQERKVETKNSFLMAFLVLIKELNTILIQGAAFVKILFSCNLSPTEFLMFFHINRSTILYLGHLTEKMPEFLEGYSKSNNIRSILQEETNPKDMELINPKGNILIKDLRIVRDDRVIINNLTANFKPGQKIAIVGQSGAGKSTLLNSIAGICQYEGEIFIDNVNLKHLTSKTINENTSYVFSSQSLFHNSLRYNITLGKSHIKDEELFDIMEKSSLGHLKSKINENLTNLSSGEKRRVVFARALWNCKRSCILLADEPFAHLDQLTARSILKTIIEISSNKTTVIVDHSRIFLEYSDMVLFFFNDHIYVGSHKNLLANPSYQEFIENAE
jgi:ABC-type multidrug transport system fused ATPase/permease subunit